MRVAGCTTPWAVDCSPILKYISFSDGESLVLSFFTIISFSQKTVEVNTDASRLMWKGSKLTSSHQGEINLKSGALEIKEGKLVGGRFIIDMTSIKNTDIEEKI